MPLWRMNSFIPAGEIVMLSGTMDRPLLITVRM